MEEKQAIETVVSEEPTVSEETENKFYINFDIDAVKNNPYTPILANVLQGMQDKKIPLMVNVKDGKITLLSNFNIEVTTEDGSVSSNFTLEDLIKLSQIPAPEVNNTVTLLIGTLQDTMKNILEEYTKKHLLEKDITDVITKLKECLHLDLEPTFNTGDIEEFIQKFVECKFRVYKDHVLKFGFNKPVIFDFDNISAKEFENFRQRLKRLKNKCNNLYKRLVADTEQTIKNDITPYITNKTDGRIDNMLSMLFDRKTEPTDISKSGNRFNFWSSDAISEITLSIGTDIITERKKETQNNSKGLSLTSDTGILLKSITTDKLLKYVTMLALNKHNNIIKLNREHYFNICNGYNTTEFNKTLDIDSNIIRNSKINVVFDSDSLKKHFTEEQKQQIETTKYKNQNIKKGMAVLDTDICSGILFDNSDIVFTLTPEYLEYRIGKNTGRYKFHLALMTISEKYRKEYFIGCKLNQYYKLGTQTTYHKLPHKKKLSPTTKGKGIIPDGSSGIKLASLLSEDITNLFRKDKPILPDLEECLNKLFEFGYLKNWYIVDSSGNKYSYEVGKREQNREILRTGWLIYEEQTEVLLQPDKNRIVNNILSNGSKFYEEKKEPVTN